VNESGRKPGNNRFKARVFVSFGVFLSFLAAAISGIILYLRPEGSLAAWTGWNAFGIDKKGWEGLHIVSIAMFVLFAAAHLGYNWKVLIGYIRRKVADGKLLWKELTAALLIILLILAGAVTRRGPVWRLVDLRSQVKEGIHLVKVGPPVPNAQDLPIAELCALINVTRRRPLPISKKPDIRLPTSGPP
jgi:hypothetical protein